MLQIQPVFAQKHDFEALAEQQGLLFEALELSFDGVSEEKYNWYKSCGRVRSIHGAFIDVNPASGDGEFVKLSEKRYYESCEKALACGAENVVYHSTCFPFIRGAYLDNWVKKSAAFFDILAEKYPQLRFFMENSFDIDPVPMAEFIQNVSSPNVKICLDIGHIHYSRASLDEWFDKLGDKTAYLHFSDNMGIYDDHLPLGKGTVDWDRALSLCAKLPGDVPVTLEVGNTAGIAESLAFLKEHNYIGGTV